jgi:hypothetical protein
VDPAEDEESLRLALELVFEEVSIPKREGEEGNEWEVEAYARRR